MAGGSDNSHNIAAWNAYRAAASTQPISQPRVFSQPHIPDWARWFEPDPIERAPQVKIIDLYSVFKKMSTMTRYLQILSKCEDFNGCLYWMFESFIIFYIFITWHL